MTDTSDANVTGILEKAIDFLRVPLASFIETTIGKSVNIPFHFAIDEVGSSQLMHLIHCHWKHLSASHTSASSLMDLLNQTLIIHAEVERNMNFNVHKLNNYLEILASLAVELGQLNVANTIRGMTLTGVGMISRETLKEKGKDYYQQSKWIVAIDCYTRALLLNDRQSVLFSHRALCMFNLEFYKLAVNDAKRAIELDSNQVKYYRILTQALLALGLYVEALAACKTGRQLDPADEQLKAREGLCETILGVANKGIATGSNDTVLGAYLFYQLGNEWMLRDEKTKNVDMAEQLYRIAAKFGNAEADAALAEILLDVRKRNVEGFSCARLAAEHDSVKGMFRLGRLYAFGHGCQRDEAAARIWLHRATDMGLRRRERDSSGKFTIDIELDIKCGKDLCSYESKENLSIEGMTIHQHVHRAAIARKPSSFSEYPLFPISFLSSAERSQMTMAMSSAEVFNSDGLASIGKINSQMANCIKTATELLNRGLTLVQESKLTEGLVLFRKAHRVYDLLTKPPGFLDAARAQFACDSSNADALYGLARLQMRSNPEYCVFLEQCVQLHPTHADFHELLACAYIHVQKFDLAVESCKRALAFEINSNYLYTLASAMMLANIQRQLGDTCPITVPEILMQGLNKTASINSEEIIEKYNEFLAANPPEHRKIPLTHYILGGLHLFRGELEEARFHHQKAQETDSDTVRLPCHTPVENEFQWKILLDMVIIGGFSALIPTKQSQVLIKSACDHCGKADSPSRCPCNTACYCDRTCQRAHWYIHKTSSGHMKQLIGQAASNKKKDK